MYHTYYNCLNLTTSVCGPNVTDMSGAYKNCTSLTTAVCGNNVTDMTNAYRNCRSLKVAIVGPNVNRMWYTFNGCTDLRNVYFYSNNVEYVNNCFTNNASTRQTNIYVHNGSNTFNKLLSGGIINGIRWENSMNSGGYYRNYTHNIYIYPVDNVAAKRSANGD